jgi:ABC-type glycerol-3-phosphate transport system substrate-binding protein
MGWNMDEFTNVLNANPQADEALGIAMTNIAFFYGVITSSINEYINWENSTVHFDTDGFVDLLELANTFPDDMRVGGLPSNELIASRRQILYYAILTNYSQISMINAVFGGGIVYKGYPNEGRNGHSLQIDSPLAISSTSENKEGAWQFIRSLLLKDRQLENNISFPINKAALYEILDEAQNPDNPDNYRLFQWETLSGEIVPLTREDADMFLALVDSVSSVDYFDLALLDIVLESASDYFKGMISVHDAVRIIQNRVSIFVSEQRG